jgi:lipoyl(octanoyl) transferase
MNMAVDEALLREVTAPVLRIYKWDGEAQTLGYFQSASDAIPGVPFIRRYTGGGLVDHRHDLTYTVVLPRAHAWMELATPESYSKIHEGVLEALTALGIDARLAPCCDENDSNACFQKAVKYDITLSNGVKLAGAAQRRTREGMLHQGSILLPDPSKNDALYSILASAMSHKLGFETELSALTEKEHQRAVELARQRYETDAWNRRVA